LKLKGTAVPRDTWKKARRPYHVCACGEQAWCGISRSPFIVVFDVEDVARLGHHNWRAQEIDKDTGGFYAARSMRGLGSDLMHRQIMNAPENMDVDHIDGQGLNNQKKNLRLVTKSQNNHNFRRLDRRNTTGFKGVNYRPTQRGYKKFRATQGKTHIGFFHTAEEAAAAYDAHVLKIWGEHAATNAEHMIKTPVRSLTE
jgi:hypothetical protein